MPPSLLALLAFAWSTVASESFVEELLLKPFANGDVLAEFNFVSRSPSASCRNHFDLLPKFVGELLHEHGVRELDLTLARGVWRTRRWGYPSHSAPAGAKVSARFDDSGNVDSRWKRLTNALSGQFCASLNFLDSTRTTVPEWNLKPFGVSSDGGGPGNVSCFRHGTLPGENVCTENLTPWKKLLPCGGKRGLATLLNAKHVHSTSFHAIGLTLRYVCPNQETSSCRSPLVELRQRISLVFDPSTLPENKHKVLNANMRLNGKDWSLRSLFGMSLVSTCPLATRSTVFLAEPGPDAIVVEPVGSQVAPSVMSYDIGEMIANGQHDIEVRHRSSFLSLYEEPELSVSRYQTGYGQERGGIVTQIRNGGRENHTVVFLDVIPWFLRVYFHTLKVTVGNNRLTSPLMTRFSPGLDRAKPYTLELVLELQAGSTTKISIEFEHSILKWNEYPPDANKGFYIGAGLVSALVLQDATHIHRRCSTYYESFSLANRSNGPDEMLIHLYSESLLVNLPTPDFSMPYNVICLACTVVALAFGPLINLTTKSLQIIEPEAASPSKLSKIVAKVKAIASKVPLANRFVKAHVGEAAEESDETKKER